MPSRHLRPSRIVCLVLACVAACSQVAAPEADRRLDTEVVRRAGVDGPPDAEPGTCWGQEQVPAIIETVTEQIRVAEGDGGTDAAPRYRTETRQRIVRAREGLWFRTPCPEDLTAEGIATLQRALAARGLYSGPVTGTLDAATRAAVRRFQQPRGLDSALLSLGAARALGIAAYGFEPG